MVNPHHLPLAERPVEYLVSLRNKNWEILRQINQDIKTYNTKFTTNPPEKVFKLLKDKFTFTSIRLTRIESLIENKEPPGLKKHDYTPFVAPLPKLISPIVSPSKPIPIKTRELKSTAVITTPKTNYSKPSDSNRNKINRKPKKGEINKTEFDSKLSATPNLTIEPRGLEPPAKQVGPRIRESFQICGPNLVTESISQKPRDSIQILSKLIKNRKPKAVRINPISEVQHPQKRE